MKIKKFRLDSNKVIKLKYFGPFIANSGAGLGRIRVDEYFYNLSNEEQKAVIWHELYHRRFVVDYLRIWWSIKSIFTNENPYWIEEFNADKYSAENYSPLAVLRVLKKIRSLYSKGIVEYNPKTHPTADERIKKVREMIGGI